MNRITKYIVKAFRNIDVSPFGSSSIPKLLFYVIWGLNSAVFLGEYAVKDHLVSVHVYDVLKSADKCTVIKKVSADAFVDETFHFVKTYEFCEASSDDKDLVHCGVKYIELSRGPPSETAPLLGAATPV